MKERLLVVGLGSIGQRHVRLARELIPGVKMAVLRHRGCDAVQKAGIDHFTTSLEGALQFRPEAA